MGAGLIVLDGLNFWQVPAVAIAGPAVSFGLVGLVSIAGKEGGAPGMALSRAVFGQRGNLLPGTLIWIARWGWETVNAVTGTYAVLAVLNLLFGIVSSNTLIMVTLVAFVGISFPVSGLGVRALRVCCTWSTYLFGCFSVLVLIHLIVSTAWHDVLSRPAGPTAMVVNGVGTLVGGVISCIPAGPDFAHYLPRTASGPAVVGATVAGAGIACLPLVLMGAVMAVAGAGRHRRPRLVHRRPAARPALGALSADGAGRHADDQRDVAVFGRFHRTDAGIHDPPRVGGRGECRHQPVPGRVADDDGGGLHGFLRLLS